MIPNQSTSEEVDSDFKRFIGHFLMNYRLYTLCIALALAIAVAANFLMIPQYKVTSSLLLKDGAKKQSAAGNGTEYLDSRLFGLDQNFQNELWVLKSNSVIEQCVKNLSLTIGYFQKTGFGYRDVYGQAPFQVFLTSNHVQPLHVRFQLKQDGPAQFHLKVEGKKVQFAAVETGEVVVEKRNWEFETDANFGELIETEFLSFTIYPDFNQQLNGQGEASFYFEFKDVMAATEEIKEQVEYKAIDKMATVVELIYKGPSVKKGVAVLNEIMDVYSIQNLERKNYHADITINYIEQQLDQIADSLKYTEDKLQQFRSSKNVLNFNDQANSIMGQYMDLENKMAELETRKRYCAYMTEHLSADEDLANIVIPSSMGIPDDMLDNQLSELMAVQSQRAALVCNNQDMNPAVPKLNLQISSIKQTILDNVRAIETATDIAIDELNKRMSRVSAEIRYLPVTQRQLGGIERKYKLNDAIYNYLLEKRAEAKITLASNIPDNMIVESARSAGPNPVSPNKQLNYLIAMVLGISLPFSFLSLKSMFNDEIDSPEFIAQVTDRPILGTIAHKPRRIKKTTFSQYPPVLKESFRTLRMNVEFACKGVPNKVILVTSCVEGEGKSFNALNLALSFAELGRRTLLVNFDLRKPTYYFNSPETESLGLTAWYRENIPLEQIIRKSPERNLDLIQSGAPVDDPVDFQEISRTKKLFENLRMMYNCIVLDSSPLAFVSDTYLLMDYADVKLIVARMDYGSKKVFRFIMNDLRRKKIEGVGIVLNDNKAYNDQLGYGYVKKSKQSWFRMQRSKTSPSHQPSLIGKLKLAMSKANSIHECPSENTGFSGAKAKT